MLSRKPLTAPETDRLPPPGQEKVSEIGQLQLSPEDVGEHVGPDWLGLDSSLRITLAPGAVDAAPNAPATACDTPLDIALATDWAWAEVRLLLLELELLLLPHPMSSRVIPTATTGSTEAAIAFAGTMFFVILVLSKNFGLELFLLTHMLCGARLCCSVCRGSRPSFRCC